MDLLLLLRLPSSPLAAGAARNAVGALAPFLDPFVIENLQLLISELVGNCVRHASLRRQDAIELSMRASPDTILVEVADGGRGFGGHRPPASVRPSADLASGWGFVLVDRIATRWGIVDGHDDGGLDDVRVWFELSPGVRTTDARRAEEAGV